MDRASSTSGYSLLEVIIAASLTVVLAALVLGLSMSGTTAQKYSERMTRVTEITQSLLDEIQNELQSSVRLFHNDAIGMAYANLLDLTGFPPATMGRLPVLDSSGVFEPDVVGSEKTGSSIIFARHAWTDEYQAISGDTYRIDLYRLQGYYMAASGPGPQPGSAIGVNLVRYVSEAIADGAQIDRIANATDRTEVLLHLKNATPDLFGDVHESIEVVWQVGQDPALADTLRQILTTGSLSDNPVSPRPSAPWVLLSDPRLSSTGMLSFRRHSLATNYAPGVMGVGRFGIIDNTGQGFPHGFEIQIIGSSAARQVLLHLSVVSTNNNGRRAFHDLQVIGDTRDL